jgi:hypothetical protein
MTLKEFWRIAVLGFKAGTRLLSTDKESCPSLRSEERRTKDASKEDISLVTSDNQTAFLHKNCGHNLTNLQT